MSLLSQRYRDLIEELVREQHRLEAVLRKLEWIRPALFVPALLLLAGGYLRNDSPVWAIPLGWLLLLGFLGMLSWHEFHREKHEAVMRRMQWLQRLLARTDRRWSDIHPIALPEGSTHFADLPTSRDLDLFGPKSLYQFACLASTQQGRSTVARWLVEWAPPDSLQQRQEAVREWQPITQQREEVLELCYQLSASRSSPDRFTQWAQSPSWLANHPWVHRASQLGPLLILLGLAAILASKSMAASSLTLPATVCLLTGLAVNTVVMLGWVGSIHDIFQQVFASSASVQEHHQLFASLARLPASSRMASQLRDQYATGPDSATEGLRHLRFWARLAHLQKNPTLFLIYLPLQWLLAWDLRVMEGLERWKERFGHRAAGWLDALGSTEALLSAATIADENPAWCFPRFLSPSDHPLASSPWVVHALGHPLLPDAQRVTNDYSWDPSRPIHLVTGSNMAGKSTWLRCLGLNQVLSRLGGPICAADSIGLPLDLATSMRVQDNLHEGVSFFMAELKRLREIVDHCRSNQALQRPTLCLLDEILQGTNSRERQIAVLRVVEKLMALQAWIAISTHDLELADQDQLKQCSTVVHFRERFETRSGEQTMIFDYRMHPGATPTTNALALLEWVGLDADSDIQEHP
jgi:hypothetical protein